MEKRLLEKAGLPGDITKILDRMFRAEINIQGGLYLNSVIYGKVLAVEFKEIKYESSWNEGIIFDVSSSDIAGMKVLDIVYQENTFFVRTPIHAHWNNDYKNNERYKITFSLL